MYLLYIFSVFENVAKTIRPSDNPESRSSTEHALNDQVKVIT